jgi:serine/threonine protein kinase
MLDVSPIEHSALPGEVLAGKYRIVRVLGRGGMGVVVLAQNLLLGQHVAIKFLGREATRTLAARLVLEARAAARLRSDHVVRVFDVVDAADGAPYIVMEHLEGDSLDQVLRHATRVPWATAVGWVLEACEGLALAHHHGIVHRDLKPANLFLQRRPDGSTRIKVLDFGIAKLPLGESLGNTTHPLGSPLYMAPEQLENASDMDARTDIWGIGVVLYQFITGKTPYPAGSVLDLAAKLGAGVYTKANELEADLPPGLSDVIDRCLQRRREERWGSVRELAVALCPFGPAGSEAIVARIDHIASGSSDGVSSFAGGEVSRSGGSAAEGSAAEGSAAEGSAGEGAVAEVARMASVSSENDLSRSARARYVSGLATTLDDTPPPKVGWSRGIVRVSLAALTLALLAPLVAHVGQRRSQPNGGASGHGSVSRAASETPATSAVEPTTPAVVREVAPLMSPSPLLPSSGAAEDRTPAQAAASESVSSGRARRAPTARLAHRSGSGVSDLQSLREQGVTEATTPAPFEAHRTTRRKPAPPASPRSALATAALAKVASAESVPPESTLVEPVPAESSLPGPARPMPMAQPVIALPIDRELSW